MSADEIQQDGVLRHWKRLALTAVLGLGLSSSAQAVGLGVGRSMPTLQFTNIHGVDVDSSSYTDRVQLVSFADRTK